MPTPASGAISINDVKNEQAAAQSGFSAVNLNDITYRRMARKPTGAISLGDLRGRYPALPGTLAAASSIGNGQMVTASPSDTILTLTISASVAAGNFSVVGNVTGNKYSSSWLIGAGVTCFDNYFVTWTLQSLGAGLTATASNSNVQITGDVQLVVNRNGQFGRSAVYLIHIEDSFDNTRYVNSTITLTF